MHLGLEILKWLYKVASVVKLGEHNACTCLCQKEHLVLFIELCTKSVKECQLPLEDLLEVIFPYLGRWFMSAVSDWRALPLLVVVSCRLGE